LEEIQKWETEELANRFSKYA